LSNKESTTARDLVDCLQKSEPKKPALAPGDDDAKEPGIKVPILVLDGCMDFFTAIDEKRTKANPHVFTDTGVMALLCCHDHPLWLVNMNTAGEKQFFIIALLPRSA
jgi:formiminotetrahydrofolate cyclodeaminase